MIVSWMTTNRCNLKCSHCYQDAGNAKEAELSTEEGKKLIASGMLDRVFDIRTRVIEEKGTTFFHFSKTS